MKTLACLLLVLGLANARRTPGRAACAEQAPSRPLLCYYEGRVPIEDSVYPCLCSHIVHTSAASVADDFTLRLDPGVSRLAGALKARNPALKLLASVGGARSERLVKSAERRAAFSTGAGRALRDSGLDGLELDLRLRPSGGRQGVAELLKALRGELGGQPEVRTKRDYDVIETSHEDVEAPSWKPNKRNATTARHARRSDAAAADKQNTLADELEDSASGLLLLRVPVEPEVIVKRYDLKNITKYVDWFTVPTHNLTDPSEEGLTFHPSRLMGLADLLNTDSMLDLLTGLGVPHDRIIISVPASGVKFTLEDPKKNTPRSPVVAGPEWISQGKLCSLLSEGGWTMERDEDLTAPYAFRNNTWLAFDDHISAGIKGTYALLRDLAGAAIFPLDDDDLGGACASSNKTTSSPWLVSSLHDAFTRLARKPRGAVLESLQDEIRQSTLLTFPGDVQLSPYRITRVVDNLGAVHVVRREARTQFECSRQGYFVHPLGCNRFYRCVKFNQRSADFTVFEYDCPAGLAFDERWEVCVWPGSLPRGSPCTGSSEIAPVPRARYACPAVEGYYADPENCRWFFACLDHARDGLSPLTAYEFRCPFGLVFDERSLTCDWPWVVEGCGSGLRAAGYFGAVQFGAGALGHGGYGAGGAAYGDASINAAASIDSGAAVNAAAARAAAAQAAEYQRRNNAAAAANAAALNAAGAQAAGYQYGNNAANVGALNIAAANAAAAEAAEYQRRNNAAASAAAANAAAAQAAEYQRRNNAAAAANSAAANAAAINAAAINAAAAEAADYQRLNNAAASAAAANAAAAQTAEYQRRNNAAAAANAAAINAAAAEAADYQRLNNAAASAAAANAAAAQTAEYQRRNNAAAAANAAAINAAAAEAGDYQRLNNAAASAAAANAAAAQAAEYQRHNNAAAAANSAAANAAAINAAAAEAADYQRLKNAAASAAAANAAAAQTAEYQRRNNAAAAANAAASAAAANAAAAQAAEYQRRNNAAAAANAAAVNAAALNAASINAAGAQATGYQYRNNAATVGVLNIASANAAAAEAAEYRRRNNAAVGAAAANAAAAQAAEYQRRNNAAAAANSAAANAAAINAAAAEAADYQRLNNAAASAAAAEAADYQRLNNAAASAAAANAAAAQAAEYQRRNNAAAAASAAAAEEADYQRLNNAAASAAAANAAAAQAAEYQRQNSAAAAAAANAAAINAEYERRNNAAANSAAINAEYQRRNNAAVAANIAALNLAANKQQQAPESEGYVYGRGRQQIGTGAGAFSQGSFGSGNKVSYIASGQRSEGSDSYYRDRDIPSFASLPDSFVSGGRIDNTGGVVLGTHLVGLSGLEGGAFGATGGYAGAVRTGARPALVPFGSRSGAIGTGAAVVSGTGYAPAGRYQPGLNVVTQQAQSIPVVQAVTPVPVVQPVARVPIVQPVAQVPLVQSVTPSSVVQPVSPVSFLPAARRPVVQPVYSVQFVQSVTPAPFVKTVTPVSYVQPVSQVPVYQPFARVPAVQPVAQIQTVQSVKPSPFVQSVTPIPVVQPVSNVPIYQSGAKVKSVRPSSFIQSVTPVPVVQSVTPVPVVQSVTSVPVFQPVSQVSVAQPLAQVPFVQTYTSAPVIQAQPTIVDVPRANVQTYVRRPQVSFRRPSSGYSFVQNTPRPTLLQLSTPRPQVSTVFYDGPSYQSTPRTVYPQGQVIQTVVQQPEVKLVGQTPASYFIAGKSQPTLRRRPVIAQPQYVETVTERPRATILRQQTFEAARLPVVQPFSVETPVVFQSTTPRPVYGAPAVSQIRFQQVTATGKVTPLVQQNVFETPVRTGGAQILQPVSQQVPVVTYQSTPRPAFRIPAVSRTQYVQGVDSKQFVPVVPQQNPAFTSIEQKQTNILQPLSVDVPAVTYQSTPSPVYVSTASTLPKFIQPTVSTVPQQSFVKTTGTSFIQSTPKPYYRRPEIGLSPVLPQTVFEPTRQTILRTSFRKQVAQAFPSIAPILSQPEFPINPVTSVPVTTYRRPGFRLRPTPQSIAISTADQASVDDGYVYSKPTFVFNGVSTTAAPALGVTFNSLDVSSTPRPLASGIVDSGLTYKRPSNIFRSGNKYTLGTTFQNPSVIFPTSTPFTPLQEVRVPIYNVDENFGLRTQLKGGYNPQLVSNFSQSSVRYGSDFGSNTLLEYPGSAGFGVAQQDIYQYQQPIISTPQTVVYTGGRVGARRRPQSKGRVNTYSTTAFPSSISTFSTISPTVAYPTISTTDSSIFRTSNIPSSTVYSTTARPVTYTQGIYTSSPSVGYVPTSPLSVPRGYLPPRRPGRVRVSTTASPNTVQSTTPVSGGSVDLGYSVRPGQSRKGSGSRSRISGDQNVGVLLDQYSGKFGSNNENFVSDVIQGDLFRKPGGRGGSRGRITSTSGIFESTTVPFRYTSKRPTYSTTTSNLGLSTSSELSGDNIQTDGGKTELGTATIYNGDGGVEYEAVKIGYGKTKGSKEPVVVVTRLSDVNPILVAKLGAQCTCRSNAIALKKPSSRGRTSAATTYSPLEYDATPTSFPALSYTSVTPAPSLAYDTLSSTPEISASGSRTRFNSAPVVVTPRPGVLRTGSPTVASPTGKSSVDVEYSALLASGIQPDELNGSPSFQDSVTSGRRPNTVGAKGSRVAAGSSFDRYGPGGLRGADETLQGSVDCQRPGLFRHPKYCNKFYACHWDEWKGRYTLHVFNCPVQLAYDSNLGACNWPSQGPACADDNLLV
ncbi:uncharacterized protein LOC134537730 [Bacillus rossius redtenbacheri]|uniref:uncharacterized protein LOC134537730 n=1 Tax=Bacillus rossius redtenbacheri TaxID=93214 RepID=UPI002FDEFD07